MKRFVVLVALLVSSGYASAGRTLTLEECRESVSYTHLALEPEEIHDETKLKKWLSLLDVDELSDRLDEAIADENYEYAKMYKDEIRRREEEGRSR